MKLKAALLGTMLLMILNLMAQDLVINEVMSSNQQTLFDEDLDTPDWIEIMNAGSDPIDLTDFVLSDSSNLDQAWTFPAMTLSPGQHLLVFASDKDHRVPPLFFQTIIQQGDLWRYLVPDSETSDTWSTIGFDDSAWSEGASGFGYGDNDDNTLISNELSIFIRKEFEISDAGQVQQLLMHIDYDDAFVAYINGVEVARANITSTGPPAFDQPADNFNHEAAMYSGGFPDEFKIENVESFLVTGTNVLAIQIHNHSTGSSDMTAIPFLSVGTSSGANNLSDLLPPVSGNYLHSNFKVSADGEPLVLLNNSGQLIDQVLLPPLPPDISYGRSPDGLGSFGYFSQPTPGAANSTQVFSGFSSEVVFSEPGGFKSGNFSLTLSASEGIIYYSVDGSDPVTSGQQYTTPISISGTTVVRAQIVSEGLISGEISSRSYLFGGDHDLPVVSIITDPDNLWDEQTGIYVMGPNASPDFPHFGANFWQDWERPINIELYEPDGTSAFSEAAGTKIFGGWSRGQAQKSLLVFFRRSYGKDEIEYPIFPGQELTRFSSLVLRNSGNDFNNTMFRDALGGLMFSSKVDKQAYRPAVLYINGEYWGIQNIREKVNEDFLANHHNLDPDDITILEGNAIPVEGDEQEYIDLINFVSSANLNLATNYQSVVEKIDLDNFIDYYIGQIFIDNKDWPGNNIKYWKSNAPNSKWRWILYDTDFGFAIWDDNAAAVNTLAFALEPNGPGWPNPPWSTLLFRRLMTNADFKNAFVNRFSDLLNSNYQSANILHKIDSLEGLISNEIADHLNRWGGSYDWWQNRVNAMKSFANDRPQNMRNHLRTTLNLGTSRLLTLNVSNSDQGYVRVNSIHTDSYPWYGTYYEGIPVQVEAIAKPGFRFVRWEGDATSAESVLTTDLTSNYSVKAVFEVDGTEDQIMISEINYASDPGWDTGDWVELYNGGNQTVNLSGWEISDAGGGSFLIPSGAVIGANEFMVVCRDQVAFEGLHSTEYVTGDFDFGLSSDQDCIYVKNASGQLMDEVCYDSESPWPSGNPGGTLSLISHYFDNSQPGSWFWSDAHGSPGINHFTETGLLGVDAANFLVFPNPTKGRLNIDSGESKLESILITDLSGKMVFKKTMINSSQFQADITDHPRGIYLIILNSPQGIRTFRILKK